MSFPPPGFCHRCMDLPYRRNGFVCVAAISGAIYLTARAGSTETVHVPDVLTALGATAIGALAGLLAPSPRGK